MNGRLLTLLAALLTAVAACTPARVDLPDDPDAPVLQIRVEGGLVPVEYALGSGPLYTLLADGRLIFEGPRPSAYPGPLIRGLLVTTVGSDDMDRVLDLVAAIGLPELDGGFDDSAIDLVYDAGTTVVVFWDGAGTEHTYRVYALGVEPPSRRPSRALDDLVGFLGELAATAPAADYPPERVRILAAVDTPDPAVEDVRPWPLPDPSAWEPVYGGWVCRSFGPDILEALADATELTRWQHQETVYDLLVRPLHPGEPDCP